MSSTGTVTGVKAGVTTITASALGMSASCTVYVTLSENAVYRIRNTGAAVFLDCNGANIAVHNLTEVQVQSLISAVNDRLAQMWRIIYIGGGFYHIRPMHKLDYALYLDGADVKLKNIGTAGNITSENANARWTIEYIDGDMCLKMLGCSPAPYSLLAVAPPMVKL